MIQVVDLFCGMGGFSSGAIQGGAEVVLAVDYWEEALKVHHMNHPEVQILKYELGNSIVEASNLIRNYLEPGKHFHLHGSPPCQALSNASNTNSDEGMVLVNWFLDLVKYMKPNSWSMENVVPLGKKLKLHHPEINFVILNSADFGVAQTRKRVFAGEGWYAKTTHNKEKWISVLEALPELEGELEMTTNKNIRQRTFDEPMRSITSKTPSQTRIVSRRRKQGEEPQSYNIENPSHTITQLPHILENIVSNTCGCNESISRRCKSVDTDINKPVKTIHNNPITIRSIYLKEKAIKIRSLTIDETKILQGFSNDYKIKCDKKKDAWIMVGNAVCPPVSKAIIQGIRLKGE